MFSKNINNFVLSREAFPRPAKRVDGCYIYERIPNTADPLVASGPGAAAGGRHAATAGLHLSGGVVADCLLRLSLVTSRHRLQAHELAYQRHDLAARKPAQHARSRRYFRKL